MKFPLYHISGDSPHRHTLADTNIIKPHMHVSANWTDYDYTLARTALYPPPCSGYTNCLYLCRHVQYWTSVGSNSSRCGSSTAGDTSYDTTPFTPNTYVTEHKWHHSPQFKTDYPSQNYVTIINSSMTQRVLCWALAGFSVL
jgi:hypothetical protein